MKHLEIDEKTGHLEPVVVATAITAEELRTRMGTADPPVVLDVRDDHEIEIARMPEALHLPVAELQSAVKFLDPTVEYVVLCHHGIRSAEMAAYMIEHGFTRVLNLLGGIDAWAREVDPTMARY